MFTYFPSPGQIVGTHGSPAGMIPENVQALIQQAALAAVRPGVAPPGGFAPPGGDPQMTSPGAYAFSYICLSLFYLISPFHFIINPIPRYG